MLSSHEIYKDPIIVTENKYCVMLLANWWLFTICFLFYLHSILIYSQPPTRKHYSHRDRETEWERQLVALQFVGNTSLIPVEVSPSPLSVCLRSMVTILLLLGGSSGCSLEFNTNNNKRPNQRERVVDAFLIFHLIEFHTPTYMFHVKQMNFPGDTTSTHKSVAYIFTQQP